MKAQLYTSKLRGDFHLFPCRDKATPVRFKMSENKTQICLKYLSLVILTAQNATVVLLTRYARTRTGNIFFSSTAVIMSEVCKLIACLFLVLSKECSLIKCVISINAVVFENIIDTLKVCVPSFIYTLQNNLLYIAISHLDVAVFQVSYQLKIITTALFTVFILKRTLTKIQWFSLCLLFTGIALVQLTQSSTPKNIATHQNPLLGTLAIVGACIMSGFAGVYFEKILKESDVSLWMRNIQLSMAGIPFGCLASYVTDGHNIIDKGFFFGYDIIVWIIILTQAVGGLMVAVVVKYADNILKGFATSIAIIISCIVSIILFDFHITLQFSIGAFLVIISVFLYGQPNLFSSQSNSKTSQEEVNK